MVTTTYNIILRNKIMFFGNLGTSVQKKKNYIKIWLYIAHEKKSLFMYCPGSNRVGYLFRTPFMYL